MADDADDGAVRSGPITLSDDMRRPPAGRGWLVAFGIVLLALIVYSISRPPAVGSLQAQRPPTWGHVTLVTIAKAEARAAGDPHPHNAEWLAAPRFRALPVLAGERSGSAEADFVVSLTGTFHAPAAWRLLPGSKASGPFLTLLVRGFDGTVTGRTITTHAPDLSRLGRTYPLRLSFL